MPRNSEISIKRLDCRFLTIPACEWVGMDLDGHERWRILTFLTGAQQLSAQLWLYSSLSPAVEGLTSGGQAYLASPLCGPPPPRSRLQSRVARDARI